MSNETTEADKLWQDLEALTSPKPEQLDLFLEKFLVLPSAEKNWSDLLHFFASDPNTDFPSVFRRIVAVVPHTKEEEISYVYWVDAETLELDEHFLPILRDDSDLMPQVVPEFSQRIWLRDID